MSTKPKLFSSIAIIPLGRVDLEILMSLCKRLEDIFGEITCKIEAAMPPTHQAYDGARQQYNSSKILVALDRLSEDIDADRILGVAEFDLFVPRLNFVFGEAQCPGKVALISLFRLKPQFYRLDHDDELFMQRITKEAMHELGHTMGYGHCSNPDCIMFFSNSIADTDRKSARFCERCTKTFWENH